MQIIIPVIYGSHAYPIRSSIIIIISVLTIATNDDIPDSSHTHKWKVYVKSGSGMDISWIFDKIQFTLHESFNNHKRVISEPPYEVEESGWGEFEIMIKFSFRDSGEKPISVFHHLKLFHSPAASPSQDTDVISERYDEVIINNPSEALQKAYAANQNKVDKGFSSQFTKAYEQRELGNLLQALNKVGDDIAVMKQRIQLSSSAASLKSSSSTPMLIQHGPVVVIPKVHLSDDDSISDSLSDSSGDEDEPIAATVSAPVKVDKRKRVNNNNNNTEEKEKTHKRLKTQ